MQNTDQILYEALSPTEDANPALNEKILAHIKEQDMKPKNNMEYQKNLKQARPTTRRRFSAAAAVAASVVALSSITAFAAWKYRSARDVAAELDNHELAAAFENADAAGTIAPQSYAGYEVSFLGMVSGKNISDYVSVENGMVIDDETYAVVAISNSDGTPMPDTSSDDYDLGAFLVSPYIEGYNPAIYNIYSLAGGGASEYVQDGVRYRLISSENIEAFADHTIYLGISDGTFYNPEAFLYDEATGAISRNPEYEGLNALFTLPFDTAKADPEKAAQIIRRIEPSGDTETAEKIEKPRETETAGRTDPSGENESMETGEDEIIPADIEAWMARLTPENIDEYAKPLESTRQTVTPDSDGFIHIKWELESGRSTDDTTAMDLLFPSGEVGMSESFSYSLTDAGLSDLIIDTYTLNEDGTVTYVAYIPEETD